MSDKPTAEDLLNEIVVAAAPFLLRRHTDVSGVSGTGVVADGVIFPAAGKGVAVVRWRGERGSTVVWDHLTHLTEIHGHGGATQIEMVPVAALVECLKSLLAYGELFDVGADEIRREIVRHLAPEDSDAV